MQFLKTMKAALVSQLKRQVAFTLIHGGLREAFYENYSGGLDLACEPGCNQQAPYLAQLQRQEQDGHAFWRHPCRVLPVSHHHRDAKSCGSNAGYKLEMVVSRAQDKFL